MKKMICILLITVLLFLLSGSTQKRALDESNIDFSDMPSSKILKTKEEIETFNKTIAESDWVPANFVKPDEWTMIGELDSFLYSGGTYPYRHFVVNVKDVNGVRIALFMRYGESYSPSGRAHLSVSDGMTSMQYLGTSESGSIERCRVKYGYHDGWLDSIIFYVQDIEITMFIDGGGPENPYPEDQQESFYTKLLSLSDEVVTEAIRELEASVRPDTNYRNWLLLTGIGLGVVALGATGFVVWKKKRRKAAVDTPDESATEL